MKLRVSLMLAAIVLVFSTGALADEARDVAAKRHFLVGKTSFEAHEYARALGEFREAYKLAPFPGLLFNIGRCHEEMGDIDDAIDVYDRYLAVAPAPEKPDIESRLLRLRNQRDIAPSRARIDVVPSTAAPLYTRWWLWTAVGVAVVGAVAIGVAASASSSPGRPGIDYPAVQF